MLEPNLFLVFLEPLNKKKIEYMVTGSVASIIYGEPRVTHDIDMVVQLRLNDVPDFISLFDSEEFYCPPEEIIKTEIGRETRGHFNIVHHKTGFKADMYPVGEDKLHKWAMSRRTKISVEKVDVWLAPPEYVIIRKLQYYKEGGSCKHLRDISRMLTMSGDSIESSLLEEKVSEYNLLTEWGTLKDMD